MSTPESQTNRALWWLASIAMMGIAIVPVGWGVLSRTAGTGWKSDSTLEKQMWSTNRTTPASVSQYTDPSTFNNVAIIPGAINSNVKQVTFDTSMWPPKMTISGIEFGNAPASNQSALTITDQTRGWSADNALGPVHPLIAPGLWTNALITAYGFSGYGGTDTTDYADGQGNWMFAPGDNLIVSVTNPQTGVKSQLPVQYPTNAQMPSLSVTNIALVTPGTSTNITGQVLFGGQELGSQGVLVSVTDGTLGGTAISNAPSQHVVTTASDGTFSINYTAPNTTENVTVTVTSDGVTKQMTFTVGNPTATIAESGGTTVVTGQNATLTASANILPTGYQLQIYDSSTSQVVTSSSSSTSLQTAVTQQSASTHTYVARILDPGGNVVNTNSSVSVQWVAPTTSLTASTANGVTGQSVSLSATGNVVPSGYTLRIINSSTSVVLSSVNGSTSTSTSVSYASQTSVTYVSQVLNPSSQVISQSGNLTVQWTSPSTSISSSSSTLLSGQSATLTGSANIVPSGYTLQIYDSSSSQVMNSVLGSTSVSASVTETPSSGATTHTYVTRLVDPSGNVISTSASTSVEWLPQFTVSLTATANSQYGFTLTATTNQSINGTGYQEYLGILDVSTSQWVTSISSGTQVSAPVSDTTSQSYVAYVMDQNQNTGTARATSSQVTLHPGTCSSYVSGSGSCSSGTTYTCQSNSTSATSSSFNNCPGGASLSSTGSSSSPVTCTATTSGTCSKSWSATCTSSGGTYTGYSGKTYTSSNCPSGVLLTSTGGSTCGSVSSVCTSMGGSYCGTDTFSYSSSTSSSYTNTTNNYSWTQYSTSCSNGSVTSP